MDIIVKQTAQIADLAALMGSGVYAETKIESLCADSPDFHVVAVENNLPAACCSVWHSETVGENLAAIGFFRANGEKAARAVLEKAEELLKAEKVLAILAPLNKNTWKSYRFVTKTDGRPPFLLEPQNPPEYPEFLRSCGFAEHEEYYSALEEPILLDEKKLSGTLSSLADKGIKIRRLEMESFEKELDIIYSLSLVCFKDNLYYTPLERESFAAQYTAYKKYIVPKLVFFAFDGEKPVGFLFTIPDYNRLSYGESADTLILKTIGVLPEYRGLGLGGALINLARKEGIRLGMKRAIHALMYSENISRKFNPSAGIFRTYTLFRKELL